MKLRTAPLLLAAALAATLSPTAVRAADLPLWEVGLGAGAVSFPDYRGSDRQRVHVLPVPYVVYRGDFLRADRNGVRGVFVDLPGVELNLSLAASTPVDSEGNDARRGMPDLDPTVEFGPELQLTLWRAPDHRAQLDFRLPVRAAFTITGSPDYAGIVASPNLNLDLRDAFGQPGWNLGLLAGPMFADRRQHRYFYDVAPQYATPDRAAYEAGGGYSGSRFLAAVSKRFPGYWVGGFVRYDNLAGARFDDSPLVREKHAWAAGFGIAWMLGESTERVAVGD